MSKHEKKEGAPLLETDHVGYTDTDEAIAGYAAMLAITIGLALLLAMCS